MRTLPLCFMVLFICLAAFTGCGSNTPPDTGKKPASPPQQAPQDVKTLDQLFDELLGSDKRAAGNASEAIKRDIEKYLPELLAIAKEMEIKRSPKAIEMLGYSNSDEARDIALQGIGSEIREIKLASIIASGRLKNPGAFDKLLQLTYSDDTGIRGNAVTALTYYDDVARVLPRLREMVVDPDVQVRFAVYGGIGKFRDPESAHLLYNALKRETASAAPSDNSIQLMLMVISQALTAAVQPSDCTWLVDGLTSDNPPEVRFTVFDIVGKLKCPDAVKPLIDICDNNKEEGYTRLRAGLALAFIGDPKGYKVSDNIYFAAEKGLLGVDMARFPTPESFKAMMDQYKGLLGDLEIKSKGNSTGD